MARAAHIMAVSEATKNNIGEFTPIPPERISVVPSGVSPTFFQTPQPQAIQALRHRLNVPAEAQIVLHVGGKVYKNTPALLRALHLLNTAMGMNVWLVRVGADLFPEEQSLVAELELLEKIVQVSGVSNTELIKLYDLADTLDFPSWWEGFGWPIMEVIACRTPVVASNAGALPQLVGQAGLMVEPQDYQRLAQMIRQVLTNDALRQSLIERGVKQAQQFTWERTAQLTLEVYEQVIQKQGRKF